MLTKNRATIAEGSYVEKSSERSAPSLVSPQLERRPRREGILSSALRIEWLGQTAASLFWIGSVFSYGIEVTGDYLQICAAFAWLLANIATLFARSDHTPPDGSAASLG